MLIINTMFSSHIIIPHNWYLFQLIDTIDMLFPESRNIVVRKHSHTPPNIGSFVV